MKKVYYLLAMGLLVIASCSKKSAPASSAKDVAMDGASLFSKNCARCHGAKGVEGRAPHLLDLGYNKTQIADIISNGKGHMPAFSDDLSQQQIAAISDFVLTLKK